MGNEIENKARQILGDNRLTKVYVVTRDGKKDIRRIAKGINGDILLMMHNSKRSGSFLWTQSWIKDIIPINKKEIKIEDQWLKQINKAINILENSGLWVDYLNDLKIAKDIGFEKINKAEKIYWETIEGLGYDENKKTNIEKIKEIDDRLICNNEGNISPKTNILFYLSRVLKIKKMNFGLHNARILLEIKNALQDKKYYHSGTCQCRYDVSFEYNPNTNKAWYSEEYKNCGNGHYYLALNDTHAMYYEDD
jgi:hypothetical protein